MLAVLILRLKMRISATILALFLPIAASATDSLPAQYSRKCIATPAVGKDKYPGQKAIIKSNNLALPTGKSTYPETGQRVVISGHVLDTNCVPVSDAIVEIWQAGPDGKYVSPTLSKRLDPYPEFVGSGRVVTDNLGKFSFVTLFPGAENETSAPHINVHVVRDGFPALNTRLFFAGDKRNDGDKILGKVAPENRHQVSGTVAPSGAAEDAIAVKWDIVLGGTNSFRKY